jgi:hypothetical protein
MSEHEAALKHIAAVTRLLRAVCDVLRAAVVPLSLVLAIALVALAAIFLLH